MNEYRATKDNPYHISCGGVICRKRNQVWEILLLHRFKSDVWSFDSWHLPKGTKIVGETDEQTVERECLEETGYRVKVLKKIGSLKSTYKLDKNHKANKITHYFLCRPIKRITPKVDEHDEVKWIEINKAIKLLSEFKLWEKEEEIVKKLLKQILL